MSYTPTQDIAQPSTRQTIRKRNAREVVREEALWKCVKIERYTTEGKDSPDDIQACLCNESNRWRQYGLRLPEGNRVAHLDVVLAEFDRRRVRLIDTSNHIVRRRAAGPICYQERLKRGRQMRKRARTDSIESEGQVV
jgi:hypothetical protein